MRLMTFLWFIFLTLPAFAQPYKTEVIQLPYSGVESVTVESRFFGYESAVNRDLTDGEPAYDYSVHLLRDVQNEIYRLYSGGRWLVKAKGWDGDHVLLHTSPSGLADTWSMPNFRPEYLSGAEEGLPNVWYANQSLEPEVLKVNGTWYMYVQVMIIPGQQLDSTILVAETGADRIMLLTSTDDGQTWQRKADRGVVINLSNPTRTALHHQEMLYVPWDKEQRPWWMYVAVDQNGQYTGYYRIRSNDPTTYDWNLREPNVAFAQLGNQVGYIEKAQGGPLFVRISFTKGTTQPPELEREVPMLQFSRNGIQWVTGGNGPARLDGSRDMNNNPNCYFLGLSTLDGCGQLESLGNGKYRAIYGATTCRTPVAPEIFHSEIGVGELILTLPQPVVNSSMQVR